MQLPSRYQLLFHLNNCSGELNLAVDAETNFTELLNIPPKKLHSSVVRYRKYLLMDLLEHLMGNRTQIFIAA